MLFKSNYDVLVTNQYHLSTSSNDVLSYHDHLLMFQLLKLFLKLTFKPKHYILMQRSFDSLLNK